MKILNWIKSNNKIVAGVTIFGAGSIYFLTHAINLISEERYRPATGCIIISCFMIGCLCFLFYNPEKYQIRRAVNKIRRDTKKQEGDLQTVLYTKDRLLITHIEEALKEQGIKCFVFDEQANAMLSFIDGIEMRILIYKDDYEKSLDIVNEILKQGQKGL